MSTTTTKKRSTGAAAVIVVLCLLALCALGYILYRQLYPSVPETVELYVESETADAVSYRDEERTPLGSILRGAGVRAVKSDWEGDGELVRIDNGTEDGKPGYLYMERASLTEDYAGAVLNKTVYAPPGHEPYGRDGCRPRLRRGEGHGSHRHRIRRPVRRRSPPLEGRL